VVTFWGRKGDEATLEAVAFLKKHGYLPRDLRDLDSNPPTGRDLEQILEAVGGALAAPEGIEIKAWLNEDAKRFNAPILLTPKGALVGFRERKWIEFLDIGRNRS
jgi:arsenate reductase-like glutaredoxin family protein